MSNHRCNIVNDTIIVEFKPETVLSMPLISSIIDEIRGSEALQKLNDLWNFCGCQIPESINYNAMMDIVSSLKKDITRHTFHTKTAFVVDNEKTYKRATVFQSLASTLPYELSVFYNKTEAFSWITNTQQLADNCITA